MQTRPLKYSRPTRNTAFSIPEDVLDELSELCRLSKIKSRSELVTMLIHQGYEQATDPQLAIERLKEKKQKIEDEKKALETEAIDMFGRSLEEQLLYIAELERQQELEEQRIREEEIRLEQQRRERAELIREKRPAIQTTLTEFYMTHNPKERGSFAQVLEERQLIDIWKIMDTNIRERILDRAKADAGWRRDNFGGWEQIPIGDLPYHQ